MKSFTDIEQSKKLAKILPIESADMSWYKETKMFPFELHTLPYSKHFVRNDGDDELLPCWSLSALLEVMPYVDNMRPFNLTKMWEGGKFNREYAKFECRYYYVHFTKADDPIDAIVEMIIWLKEEGLI